MNHRSSPTLGMRLEPEKSDWNGIGVLGGTLFLEAHPSLFQWFGSPPFISHLWPCKEGVPQPDPLGGPSSKLPPFHVENEVFLAWIAQGVDFKALGKLKIWSQESENRPTLLVGGAIRGARDDVFSCMFPLNGELNNSRILKITG